MSVLWQLARARNSALDHLLTIVMGKPSNAIALTRLGSHYGGFWVPTRLLDQRSGLLVSAGIGSDVTFDLEFLRLGYRVIALDPLPECVSFAENEFKGRDALVIRSGLWSSDGSLKFHAPRQREHDSWSAINIQETAEQEAVEFEVVSLLTVAAKFPDIEKLFPKVLKLNIEGAEAEVLRNLNKSPLRFDVIVVHLESLSQVRLRSPGRFFRESWESLKLFKDLRNAGYRVVRTSNLQMCLIGS